MDPLLVLFGGFVLGVVVFALARPRLTARSERQVAHRSLQRDSEIHRRRAEAMGEVEEHDIDEMLDAINDRRRRAGRREIGEELADDLIRRTWE